MPDANASPHADSPSERAVRPRRSVPGTRALAGGVLVALAAVGTFVAADGSRHGERSPVVVATHDLAPGSRLSASDLAVVRMQLSPEAARHVAASPDRLQGTTVLGPVRAGELLQAGNVVRSPASGGVEVAFALPSARALGGSLRPGESVDVLASDKNGNGPARTIVQHATVVRVGDSSSGGIAHNGDLVVTLAVPSTPSAADVAGAVDRGQVTLVRTTGASS